MKEIWKNIKDFPDYKISNYGRVKSFKRLNPIILKPGLRQGYKYVNLSKGKKQYPFRIHILVLENFIGKRPKNKQAHYIDFNKENNRIDNLKWATRKEILENTVKAGKKVLSEDKIIENFKKGKSNYTNIYREIKYLYKMIKKDNSIDREEDKNIINMVKKCNYDFKKTGDMLNISKEWVRQIITKNHYIVIKYLLIDGKIKAEKIMAGKGKCRMGKQIKIHSIHKKQLETVVKNLNRIINAIREYIPEANIFFNGEGDLTLNIHAKDITDKNWKESWIYSTNNIEHSDCGGY